MRAGERVAVDPRKEDPLDFPVWKAGRRATGVAEPLGAGRPGWHIECSAMSRGHLGAASTSTAAART